MHKILSIVFLSVLISSLAADTKLQAFVFDATLQQYWQQCEAGMEYSGHACQGSAVALSWQKALVYCAALSPNKTWRLPTRDELLRYYALYGNKRLHLVNLYWTATTDVEHPELAWYLIPELRWVYTNYKELDGLVLCVANPD